MSRIYEQNVGGMVEILIVLAVGRDIDLGAARKGFRQKLCCRTATESHTANHQAAVGLSLIHISEPTRRS